MVFGMSRRSEINKAVAKKKKCNHGYVLLRTPPTPLPPPPDDFKALICTSLM